MTACNCNVFIPPQLTQLTRILETGDAPSERSPDSTDDRCGEQPKLNYEEAVEEAGVSRIYAELLYLL